MKTNKKPFIIIPIIIAILLFIGLYIYFNSEDSNSFSASERRWLESNKNKIENIEVIADYPIYGNSGVFNRFVADLEEATGLDFNIIPYYRGKKTETNDIKFRIVKDESDIGSNDIFYEDHSLNVANNKQFETSFVNDSFISASKTLYKKSCTDD